MALDHSNDDTMGKAVYKNQGFEFALVSNYTTNIIQAWETIWGFKVYVFKSL